jgi:hypothetical protein
VALSAGLSKEPSFYVKRSLSLREAIARAAAKLVVIRESI